jgi:hypothetical protein
MNTPLKTYITPNDEDKDKTCRLAAKPFSLLTHTCGRGEHGK